MQKPPALVFSSAQQGHLGIAPRAPNEVRWLMLPHLWTCALGYLHSRRT